MIDAVDAWEKRGGMGEMMGSLFGSMVCKDDDSRAKWEAEQAKSREKAEQKARLDRERGIMLKAKLIQIRDGIDAHAFLEAATS